MSGDAVAKVRSLIRRISPEGRLQHLERWLADFQATFGELDPDMGPEPGGMDYQQYQWRVEAARFAWNGEKFQEARIHIAEAGAEFERLRLKHHPALIKLKQ